MDFARAAIIVWAFYIGIRFVRYAISASSSSTPREAPQHAGDLSERHRIQRADEERERKAAQPRYAVALIAFCTAGAVLAGVVSALIAYAVLCLALVGRAVADQIAEERAPRRRSALIGRARRVDAILFTWMALAGVASLVLVPWFLDEAYRVAAGVVALCVLAMLGIAWRIATAPPLLFGEDIEAEEVVDRETRTIRTGNACAIALAPVFVFLCFVGGDWRLALAVLLVCVGISAWKSVYSRGLSRTPLASCLD